MAAFERRESGRWRAKIRRKGYEDQERTFDSKSEAQAWARKIESQMDRGEAVDSRESATTTLAEALARYEREITPTKAESGQRPERVRIARLQAQPFAARALSRIRGGDLAEYRDARLLGVTVEALVTAREDGLDALTLEPTQRPVGGNTVRLELAVLSHLYTTAKTDWKMAGLANPVESVRKPKLPKPRDRRLQLADGEIKGEETRLLEAADPVLAQVITLALETAMRRGEIAGLERRQIDRRRMVIALEATKNGDDRDVPLSPRALQAIDALPARVDGSLLGADAANVASWISHAFEDLCDDLGLEDLTFHDLRHEAISRLFERGLAIEEVAAISGHRTWAMLRRYTHLRGEDLARKLA